MAEKKMGVTARRNMAKKEVVEMLGLDDLHQIDTSVFVAQRFITEPDGSETEQCVKVTIAACNMEGTESEKRPVDPFDLETAVAQFAEDEQERIDREAKKIANKAKKLNTQAEREKAAKELAEEKTAETAEDSI